MACRGLPELQRDSALVSAALRTVHLVAWPGPVAHKASRRSVDRIQDVYGDLDGVNADCVQDCVLQGM